MKVIGMITVVAVAALLLVAIVVLIRSIPDIKRYKAIRRM